MGKRQKAILFISLFVLLIWISTYFLMKSLFQLKNKLDYYNISNKKYETLYSERRTDIFKTDYEDAILNNGTKYYIIDTRENEEFDIWHIPWTRHIRIWDLFWDLEVINEIKEIVKSGKQVLLLCHDWDRSIEIASYYKDNQWVDIWYIDGWVDAIRNWYSKTGWFGQKKDPRIWTGKYDVYFDYENEFKILNADEVKSDYIINISYDMTNKYRNEWSHCIYNDTDPIVKKSIYGPIRNMPTTVLNKFLADIWSWSVTTVCYSQSTCFFSKVLWYRITNQWWRFDWIYILDWSNCIDRNQDFKTTQFRDNFAPFQQNNDKLRVK